MFRVSVEPSNFKDIAWREFEKLSPEGSCAPSEHRAQINTEPCEDYTEVFLCHARLYVFADKHHIEPLRKLAKHKLQRTLIAFNLYTERIADVVELIRYVYENTPPRGHTRDELRELVMRYVVCQYDKLALSEDFLNLMEEGGACVRDCFSMLCGIVK